jgi:hypothetical protein
MPAFYNEQYDLRDILTNTSNPYNCITPILNLNTGDELTWYNNQGKSYTFERPEVKSTDPSKVKRNFEEKKELFRKISGFPDEEKYQLHRGDSMEGHNEDYYDALLKNLENNTGLMPANLPLLNKNGDLIKCNEEKYGCPFVMLTDNAGKRIPVNEEILKMVNDAHNSTDTSIGDNLAAQINASMKPNAEVSDNTTPNAEVSDNTTPEAKDASGEADKEDIAPPEPVYPDYKEDILKELSSPVSNAQEGLNNVAAFLSLSLEQRNVDKEKQIDENRKRLIDLERKKKEEEEQQLKLEAMNAQNQGMGSGGFLDKLLPFGIGRGKGKTFVSQYNDEITSLKTACSKLTKDQMWNKLRTKEIVDSVAAYNQNVKKINDTLERSKTLTESSDIEAVKRQVSTLKSNMVKNLEGFNNNVASVMNEDQKLREKNEPGLIDHKQEIFNKLNDSLEHVSPFNTDNNPVAEEIKKDTGLDEANKDMMKKIQDSIKAFIEALLKIFGR